MSKLHYSSIVSIASNGPLTVNDDSLQDPIDPGYRIDSNFGALPYSDVLWRRGQIMGGGMFQGVRGATCILDSMALKWDVTNFLTGVGGTQERVPVSGYVYDTNGAPVSGATVKLYDTPTDTVVDTGTTDATGYYLLSSPYTSNAYVVAYKPGSPDTAGTTVNTVPA